MNNIREGLASSLRERELTVLKAGNFSGRTALLRSFTGLGLELGNDQTLPSAYIGPEVVNAISGLASTVEEEIRLHCRTVECLKRAAYMGEHLNISHLYKSNPFVLSGGEQVALALTSSVALNPVALAVDSALEQLAVNLRNSFVGLLRAGRSPRTLLADNRISEYEECFSSEEIIEAPWFDSAESEFRKRTIKRVDQQCLGPTRSCQISTEGVSFSYTSGRPILRDVSLCLEPGSVYQLVGNNGAGKSTLAKILVGVLRPKRGSIFLGKSKTDFWRAPGQTVGYSFQNPDLQLFSGTVWDEVSVGLRGGGNYVDVAKSALSAFGLEGLEEQHPLDLPFVLRKRLTLAAAFGSGRPWIILDEPSLGQDDEAVSAMVDLIDGYSKRGGGVILISHSASLFGKLNPCKIFLDNGQVSQGGRVCA